MRIERTMAKQTPLHDEHVKLGARMVEFAGWEMPVQYSGVIDEHKAVRRTAGIFDVSHMGQIEVTGSGATDYVQYLTTNNARKLVDGQAQYSILCREGGGVIDDVIVYRIGEEKYVIVVNAINAEKDLDWLRSNARDDVNLEDISPRYAMIALQGPKSEELLAELSDANLPSIQHYHFHEGGITGKECIIARTGYTGEDGFEIFVSPADVVSVWQAILERGKPRGVLPAGLGARDTLRTEMRYSLYGHEITEETNPLEAGLGWVVKLKNDDDFIGKEAIKKIKEEGLARTLVGFKMQESGIPRQGYPIKMGDREVGVVTSGTMSPSLGEAIGIGFVPTEMRGVGTEICIDIRGRSRKATIVETPFYRKDNR
jgi:aminomethyltransferase